MDDSGLCTGQDSRGSGRGTHQDSVVHLVPFALQFDPLLDRQLDLSAHSILDTVWGGTAERGQVSKSDSQSISQPTSQLVRINFP